MYDSEFEALFNLQIPEDLEDYNDVQATPVDELLDYLKERVQLIQDHIQDHTFSDSDYELFKSHCLEYNLPEFFIFDSYKKFDLNWEILKNQKSIYLAELMLSITYLNVPRPERSILKKYNIQE